LKLSSLFAKYLYQHKQLRLPGIGVFTLDPSVIIPDPGDKSYSEFLQHIRYTQQPVTSPDEDFINFIRTETGKIKPLAESDLDSFLSDGKILLNIGKPFHIEGIGALQKTREGVYEFTPGEPLLHKMEAPSAFEPEDPNNKSKTFYLDSAPQSTGARKLLIALGAIAGIVIVIWGGYILYNKNTTAPSAPIKDSTAVSPNLTDSQALSAINDTAVGSLKADSLNRRQQVPAGTYKFVIERTANKDRAIRRYNQLLEHLANVKIETQDSTLFKLFFVLPATPADTARIRDSLKMWYGRKRVYVE
jgi:hypothetical protein